MSYLRTIAPLFPRHLKNLVLLLATKRRCQHRNKPAKIRTSSKLEIIWVYVALSFYIKRLSTAR